MSIAVYAGTFDPVTVGHLSVLRQAIRLSAHVVVLVAQNPDKWPLFTVEERVEMLREALSMHPNVSVASTAGMVVDYARLIGATVLIRGIRSGSDAEFEMRLAGDNRRLAPEIATVLLPAEASVADVSSSRLKERWREGDDVSSLCPPAVAARLATRLAGGAA